MSEQTTIQWCDSTWNPWVGCEKVSEGCKNCYAEALANRFGKDFSKRSVSKDATFNAPLKWRKKPWVCENDHPTTGLGDDPLGGPHCDICGGEVNRRRVFLGSMMDWLDPKISIDVFAKMLDIVRRCPELDFLCVTKRPELWYGRINEALMWLIPKAPGDHDKSATAAWLAFWKCGEQVPQNVWIIATVENQEMAWKRIPELLRIPAVVRGLSVEPMLGPIDLTSIRWKTQNDHHGNPQADHYENVFVGGGKFDIPKVDWVIVGGESGKNARACHVEWVRSIVRQCAAAGVPCFVKQLGSNCKGSAGADYSTKHQKGGDPSEWPEDLRVQQFPKVRRTI